jgi:hypothetical protein
MFSRTLPTRQCIGTTIFGSIRAIASTSASIAIVRGRG